MRFEGDLGCVPRLDAYEMIPWGGSSLSDRFILVASRQAAVTQSRNPSLHHVEEGVDVHCSHAQSATSRLAVKTLRKGVKHAIPATNTRSFSAGFKFLRPLDCSPRLLVMPVVKADTAK
jgi:hypothetical protein